MGKTIKYEDKLAKIKNDINFEAKIKDCMVLL